MNVADANRLESGFHHIGLKNTEEVDDADIIVLNSCVVRQSAEDKVHGMLSSLRHIKDSHPTKIIALMGCLVGPNSEKLQKRYPHVDVFMRPQQFKPLFDLINSVDEIDVDGCLSTLSPVNPSVTAFVPIIHGCDKFCTFCIIPYRRGREVSRPIVDIVKEIELLSLRNVKEVTLLGQNVDSYGHDFLDKKDLADLFYAVNEIKGIERIRFLTSHPNDMSDKIIDAINSIDKVCEHINLPFQAGDDEVWTLEDGESRWFLYDFSEQTIVEEIENMLNVHKIIECLPSETRIMNIGEDELSNTRKKIELHIFNTIMRDMKIPMGYYKTTYGILCKSKWVPMKMPMGSYADSNGFL